MESYLQQEEEGEEGQLLSPFVFLSASLPLQTRIHALSWRTAWGWRGGISKEKRHSSAHAACMHELQSAGEMVGTYFSLLTLKINALVLWSLSYLSPSGSSVSTTRISGMCPPQLQTGFFYVWHQWIEGRCVLPCQTEPQ